MNTYDQIVVSQKVDFAYVIWLEQWQAVSLSVTWVAWKIKNQTPDLYETKLTAKT